MRARRSRRACAPRAPTLTAPLPRRAAEAGHARARVVAAQPYDPLRTPLEVLVERRRDARDRRRPIARMLTFAVEAGLHFLRMLELQTLSKSYRSVFITRLRASAARVTPTRPRRRRDVPLPAVDGRACAGWPADRDAAAHHRRRAAGARSGAEHRRRRSAEGAAGGRRRGSPGTTRCTASRRAGRRCVESAEAGIRGVGRRRDCRRMPATR